GIKVAKNCVSKELKNEDDALVELREVCTTGLQRVFDSVAPHALSAEDGDLCWEAGSIVPKLLLADFGFVKESLELIIGLSKQLCKCKFHVAFKRLEPVVDL